MGQNVEIAAATGQSICCNLCGSSASEHLFTKFGFDLVKCSGCGLVFVGIDVIGGRWLTEINVTSPTGIVAIDRFNGTDTPGRIWDAIERRHRDMAGGRG